MLDNYNNTYSPNELMHYGILGMRWGIRRTPEELGHEILKNEHRQAETAAKIARMERKHESNPNRPYRKSEARLYKLAEKLKREHDDLEMDKEVAEKHQKVLESKAQLKQEKQAMKDAENAKKKAEHDRRVAEKEAKEREKLNSHNLQNKPLAEMTDRELVDYLNRKANEQRYNQLNPKPRSFMDDVVDFAKKNSGKALQGFVDVGLDLGKEAIKREIKKEWDLKDESPNSREKYQGKSYKSLNDSELKKWQARLETENKVKNALNGKVNKGMSHDEVEQLVRRLLNEQDN